jgi:hypothetical protein
MGGYLWPSRMNAPQNQESAPKSPESETKNLLRSAPPLACRYVAILRCRTWCRWPEWARFQSPAFKDPIVTSAGANVYLSLHIATYKDRARPENSAAAKLDTSSGPILWRGTDGVGYWVGGARIKAPEDEIWTCPASVDSFSSSVFDLLSINLTPHARSAAAGGRSS